MSDLPVLVRSFDPGQSTVRYAGVAWFYNLWVRLTEERAVKRALSMIEIADGSSILEVAVGTGRLFSLLATGNPGGRNEVLDLSPDMLERARRRMGSLPAASWSLRTGSAYELPFEDNSFDFLFNTYMLDLLPEADFPRILAEFKRVLKPSGQLILISFSFGDKGYHRMWYWIAKKFPGIMTNCRPVRLGTFLESLQFTGIRMEMVSQNSFPSDIYTAVK